MNYIIIILLTIFFSSRADLLYENITGVLIIPEYRIYTIIYILTLAFFFACKTYKIFKRINTPKIYKMTIISTGVIMCVGAITPYHLNSDDIVSFLHVFCCMNASISFLIHLFIYFYYLKFYNIEKYQKYFSYFMKSIEFLILLTIIFGRMNGYIEIIYCIIVCSTLFVLEEK